MLYGIRNPFDIGVKCSRDIILSGAEAGDAKRRLVDWDRVKDIDLPSIGAGVVAQSEIRFEVGAGVDEFDFAVMTALGTTKQGDKTKTRSKDDEAKATKQRRQTKAFGV
ncbi:MAG: hypothetical protein Q9163_002582 [Psora crenata]